MSRDTTIYNDEQLLMLLRADDETAMTVIYNTYAKGMLDAAFNVLRDRSLAEDILQEVFVSLWLKRKRLVINSSLRAYLYTSIRYQVFKAIRRGKGSEGLFEQLEERIWGEPSPENLLYHKELQARVNKIVTTLPAKCQEIYILSREQHLSHREIAEKLQITTKAVEFQITIALKRIRQSLLFILVIFFR